jgi:hypothetical protein
MTVARSPPKPTTLKVQFSYVALQLLARDSKLHMEPQNELVLCNQLRPFHPPSLSPIHHTTTHLQQHAHPLCAGYCIHKVCSRLPSHNDKQWLLIIHAA